MSESISRLAGYVQGRVRYTVEEALELGKAQTWLEVRAGLRKRILDEAMKTKLGRELIKNVLK